ncbi:MAG: hypothetical protein E7329_02975 [Clostridiales bacterium]|nr:hypothetical protein [Clostridiales bacterium]
MKAGIYIAAAAVGLCVGGAVVVYGWYRKKKAHRRANADTVEARFLTAWTEALSDDARLFNGLYSGLYRVTSGTVKRPEKILREWCQRTHYRWENEAVDMLCQEHLVPLIEAVDENALTKWASLLLDAASTAGIMRESAEKLVLTDRNTADYVEWDGNDLYSEDEIEIITPAWYQNGKLLEQGQCRKVSVEAY